MELKRYYTILRKRVWAVLLCMVATTVASYLYASSQTFIYEARSRYLVGPAISNPAVTSNDLRASSQIGQTYAELATSQPVVQEALDRIGLADDAGDVANNITATWIDVPQILNIRVRAEDPEVAANIANAVGAVLIERSPSGPETEQAARQAEIQAKVDTLQASIAAIQSDMDRLGYQLQLEVQPANQQALIAKLDQRRADLNVAQRNLDAQLMLAQNNSTNQISVVEQAEPRRSPVEPQVQRSVVIAALAGAMLGIVLIFLIEYLADAIYTPGDVRSATGLRYLGSVLLERRRRGAGNSRNDAVGESYQILRVGLHTAGVGGELKSVLVAGASPSDETSSVAANLALAFAATGRRVTLVDANTHEPRLAARFGLREEGLATLLGGGATAPLLQPVPGAANLSLLAAGAPAAARALDGDRVKLLLDQLEQSADLVIVSSASLPSSDTLVLAGQVNGVLLSATSGITSRESARQAAEALEIVRSNVVGAILVSPTADGSRALRRGRPAPAEARRGQPDQSAEGKQRVAS